MRPQDKLAAGRLWAGRRWPYFRSGVASLVPRPTEGLGTLAVSEAGQLLGSGWTWGLHSS